MKDELQNIIIKSVLIRGRVFVPPNSNTLLSFIFGSEANGETHLFRVSLTILRHEKRSQRVRLNGFSHWQYKDYEDWNELFRQMEYEGKREGWKINKTICHILKGTSQAAYSVFERELLQMWAGIVMTLPMQEPNKWDKVNAYQLLSTRLDGYLAKMNDQIARANPGTARLI